ncbi:hypothetical protein LMB49_00490 [Limosilactobacillus reuteri]|uniref:hypothetical protein n=1 Tax=Limosilactobacillus reuteri TaxID=1598 RepID=UPI001E4C5F26|nr:hypothetical protein [Limosilactobacillus reuteri]MCC4369901.1 hypothetical protein [Limosilactobacillus reuteri]MCC4507471.1 hypothetical protein [Limosilactobacillus reuteri]
MKNYQVTAAIEEEKNLIKAITAEINSLMAKKNSSTATIRSYRARYQYWRNNILSSRKLSLDLLHLVKEYNDNLAALNRVKELNEETSIPSLSATLDNLEQCIERLKNFEIVEDDQLTDVLYQIENVRQTVLKFKKAETNEEIIRYNETLRNAYEDEVAQSNAKYQQQLAEYEQRLVDYQKQAKKVMNIQESIDYFNNSVAHGSRVLGLVTDTKLRIDRNAISDLTTSLLTQYEYSNETLENAYGSDSIFQFADLNWDGLQELYSEGNSSIVKHEMELGIMRTTERWRNDIETIQVERVQKIESNKPTKPQRQVVEKPKYLPEKGDKLPVFMPTIGQPIENVAKIVKGSFIDELLSEMDTYLTGPYQETAEHRDKINEIAEKLGNGCPRIVFEDDSFSNDKLVRLLTNLEDNFSSFGSQRNSAKGREVIDGLKDSANQLKNARNYTDLEDASRSFSHESNLMIMWLTSNWWQNGGKPEGEVHPWKGKYARRLTKPR